MMILPLLLLFALLFVPIVEASALKDALPNCDELVGKDMCRTDPEYMKEYCQASCAEWLKTISKVEVRHVSGDESFFDLEAINATGSTISFERFEGYVTIVANGAKSCVEGVSEKAFAAFESLKQVWPHTLEIVVFTFEHPDVSYVHVQDCSSHEIASKQEGRTIHVMEQVKINGPDTHPVYRYLKEIFEIEDLSADFSTFFLITPDGDTIEVHHGATLSQLKAYIRQHLDRDL